MRLLVDKLDLELELSLQNVIRPLCRRDIHFWVDIDVNSCHDRCLTMGGAARQHVGLQVKANDVERGFLQHHGRWALTTELRVDLIPFCASQITRRSEVAEPASRLACGEASWLSTSGVLQEFKLEKKKLAQSRSFSSS